MRMRLTAGKTYFMIAAKEYSRVFIYYHPRAENHVYESRSHEFIVHWVCDGMQLDHMHVRLNSSVLGEDEVPTLGTVYTCAL